MVTRHLNKLKKEAEAACSFRGHVMQWEPPVYNYMRPGRHILSGMCVDCKKWVQVNTMPMPNDIEIGGDAVALNCTQ